MRLFLTSLVVAGFPALAYGGSLPLLEIAVEGTRYEGAAVHWNEDMVWWLGRDGRVETFDPNRVTDFRQLGPQFRGYSSGEMRSNLLKEFPGYTVTGTGHYLVCHSPQTQAGYAQIFEEIYRSFTHYFTVRGFTVERPSVPLVAILLPDRTRFEQYAAREGTRVPRDVVGFYLRQSNRIALYDATAGGSVPALQGQNAETMIHEATHQVAFNVGLHDRFAENPTWVVEGLAMLFEAPGVWNPRANPNPASRLNRDRLDHFRQYAARGRARGSLQAFVESDESFRSAPLDAYSEAWALTCYLVETRRERFAGYLRQVAGRERGSSYSAADRLADFKSAFGEDLDLLEANYLRFIAAL